MEVRWVSALWKKKSALIQSVPVLGVHSAVVPHGLPVAGSSFRSMLEVPPPNAAQSFSASVYARSRSATAIVCLFAMMTPRAVPRTPTAALRT